LLPTHSRFGYLITRQVFMFSAGMARPKQQERERKALKKFMLLGVVLGFGWAHSATAQSVSYTFSNW